MDDPGDEIDYLDDPDDKIDGLDDPDESSIPESHQLVLSSVWHNIKVSPATRYLYFVT